MLPNTKVLISHALLSYDVTLFGDNMRSMLSQCNRTVPFKTVNVVARVALLSRIGMLVLSKGDIKNSFLILTAIHRFCDGQISWFELVRRCERIQRDLDLTDDVCEAVLCKLRNDAHSLLENIVEIPGDIFDETGILVKRLQTLIHSEGTTSDPVI